MTISLPPKGNDAKVIDAYFSALRVQAHATPQMTAKVSAGSYWLADNTHQEYSGGTTPTIFAPSLPTGAWWAIVTVTKNGVLNTVYGDAVAGTPILPAPAEYFDELPIAAIYLTDTTTAITSEMIFDIRPLWSVPVDSISQAQLDDFATIVYVNNQVATKADTTGTPEATFILNANASSVNYSGIEVNRAVLPDVGVRFNELATSGSPAVLDPQWEFTNDGSTWQPLGIASNVYYTKIESDAAYAPIAHVTDETIHITSDQNTFLDALTLTGSPALTGADANQLIGIGGNVQTLLDAKLDDVAGTANNIAILDGAGELVDSTWTLNDVDGGSPYSTTDLWSANQIVTYSSSIFSSNYVDLTTNQVVGGIKTFSDDIIITGDLTVGGTDTTLNTTNLTVADTNVTLNFGYVGATSGSDGGGLTVERNLGTDPATVLSWDDATTRWQAGLVGSEANIALEGVTLAQPFYETQAGNAGSPVGSAVYNLTFAVPAPVGATAALQVFVNGIKQMEGAGKAFTANYTGNVIVTFEAGSEPTPGADVEFYGFGYIA